MVIIVTSTVLTVLLAGFTVYQVRRRVGHAAQPWLVALGIFVVFAATAVSAGAAGEEDEPVWAVIASAGAVAIAGMIKGVIDPHIARLESTEERRRVQRARLQGIGTYYPRFSDVQPNQLGIKPSALTSHIDSRGLPAYVPRRPADGQLDAALAATLAGKGDRYVVVSGPPKAGKTRTLYESILRCAAKSYAVFIIHAPADSGADDPVFGQLLKLAGHLRSEQLAIWIDDAHRYFDRGLTSHGLEELTACLPNAVVAMTVHTSQLRTISISDERDIRSLLYHDARTATLSLRLSDHELTTASVP